MKFQSKYIRQNIKNKIKSKVHKNKNKNKLHYQSCTLRYFVEYNSFMIKSESISSTSYRSM
jgi:hypothetical protein